VYVASLGVLDFDLGKDNTSIKHNGHWFENRSELHVKDSSLNVYSYIPVIVVETVI
jgi:hypothetical protein